MKIFLLAIGARDRASSRLRIWDHVDWLRGQDKSVRADSLVPLGAKVISIQLVARIIARVPRWIAAFLWADAIVLQEVLLLSPLLLIKNLGKDRRVVFDFSDPVDRHGSGWKGYIRRAAFELIVRRADIVMVENRSYLDLLRGRARTCMHFYGPVDATRYGGTRAALLPRRHDAPVRIGWTGSPGTYRFIAPLMPVIDVIARDHPIEVMLIGVAAIDYDFRHATLRLVAWDETTEFATVPTFDLGLFRLDDSEDALWRGAGKLFIYMAAGVPFLANDRGIARDLMAEAGVGFRVAGGADWETVLRNAVANRDARDRMATASLDRAAMLSYEAYRATLMAALAAPGRRNAT
ncbi:hypothetical protein IFT67_16940 [Sphingomonas sp. CFBP 13728]|uniref:hypothetical protein n=1 Tax=Sphingomonas sp. CFBP 13728 TaxID=2775294 RepID=UPI00177C8706|nr:hypothetical protein [Sphingomonas sp. CFBP 13728]MBD8620610.1 hypothetical protein [Sphingomonas sp. CFBP 13728]